ncbi:MAG: NTP transferase domain-containing protein [Chloroflexi bacterium]|nr:NTP transferase domain-containing protein [Chloroflexota bacterium]
MSGRVTAIVLAAGAGSRFGGDKLLARLEGRPVLRHVLDAIEAAGIHDTLIVVPPGNALATAFEGSQARPVVNQDPSRGLSSSLQTGWAAAVTEDPPPDVVIVALGDQPLLDPAVIVALLEAPPDADRPVVEARHADGSRNPVRLEPAAAHLVGQAHGDRGLGPLLDANPGLVRTIDVAARNPDVDRRADLVALIEAAWRERVEANGAQVERFREAPDGRDFYAKVSRTFVADPDRTGDTVLDALVALARPADTWLDIGAGAGRYALPIARHVREVVAVDPSPAMLEALRTAAGQHGIDNVRTFDGRWPADTELRRAVGPDPVADVALIAHVSYDIAAIGPFVDALEAAARRLCVAVLMQESPAAVAAPFWPPVHGEARVGLPALERFVELLEARGARPTTVRLVGERRRWTDHEELLTFLRRQLWTRPGSAADERLEAAITGLAMTADDGTVTVPAAPVLDLGIVTWAPSESC